MVLTATMMAMFKVLQLRVGRRSLEDWSFHSCENFIQNLIQPLRLAMMQAGIQTVCGSKRSSKYRADKESKDLRTLSGASKVLNLV